MPGRCSNTANPNALYKYSGKELDEEIGINWYYFGARYYDPGIGRWLALDPKANKYPSLSPYVYCANNPFRYIDPNGREIRNTHYSAIRDFFRMSQSNEYYQTQKILEQIKDTPSGHALYSKLHALPQVINFGVGKVLQSDDSQDTPKSGSSTAKLEDIKDNKANKVEVTIDLEQIDKASKSMRISNHTQEFVDNEIEPTLTGAHELKEAENLILGDVNKDVESEAIEFGRKVYLEIIKKKEKEKKDENEQN